MIISFYITYFKCKKINFESLNSSMNISTDPNVVFVSKLISNFFNPFTSLVLYFIYFSYRNYNFLDSIYLFLPIFLIIILPVSVWIFWNVKKGNYQNLDVSNRIKRKSLYIFINLAIFAYLLYDLFIKGNFDITIFYLLVLLIIMQLSNYFIKSSMHTALNIFVSALFLSQNFWLGIFWIGISILVGISRIVVKRHTPKEVLMGSLLSTIVSFAYLYTFIQMQNG